MAWFITALSQQATGNLNRHIHVFPMSLTIVMIMIFNSHNNYQLHSKTLYIMTYIMNTNPNV